MIYEQNGVQKTTSAVGFLEKLVVISKNMKERLRRYIPITCS